jgi:subtilisin family serine protease
MKNRAVVPTIVEARAGKYNELFTALRQAAPTELLQPARIGPLRSFLSIENQPILSGWKPLQAFNMIAVPLSMDMIEAVASWNSVEKLYPDSLHYALQYPTAPPEGVYTDTKGKAFTSTLQVKKLMGLDKANTKGYNGANVRVVVADTGCNVLLPQVRHVHTHTVIPEKGGTGIDMNGHGTWCNSCLGGSMQTDPFYNVPVEGMAPGCELHSVQCLGFVIGVGSSSDIIAAMEYALELKAKVLSLSLGSDEAPPDAENPEAVAIDQLTAQGCIVTVAGGNSGAPETVGGTSISGSIGSPGTCKNSLTVGAVDAVKGILADFSSRGPTKGDGYIKPDVVGYGVREDSQITGYLDRQTDQTARFYGVLTGTSMTTPAVAGQVACMSQLYDERIGKPLTTDEVKAMMTALGHEKNNDDGWGLLNWDIVERWASTQYNITV